MNYFHARCRGAVVRNTLRRKIEHGQRYPAMMVSEVDVLSSNASLTSVAVNADDCDTALVEYLFGHSPPNSISDCDIFQTEKWQRQNEIYRSTTHNEKAVARVASNDNLIAFQFEKFAAAYFQIQNNAHYMRKPLRTALLSHDSDLDRAAALAIWLVIQRFMDDTVEPRISPPPQNFNNVKHTSVISKLHMMISGKDVFKRTSQRESDYEQVSCVGLTGETFILPWEEL
uniref:Bm12771 n=1 Tax=Brugia malayi TaxID=6279 RepID=A0A1I9GEC9_BRUMA|nr:Bm12771 [Brugia malayi]